MFLCYNYVSITKKEIKTRYDAYFSMGSIMKNTKVYEQYNKITTWFDEHRNKELMEQEYLDFMILHIPQNASILDLGCGSGEPIAKYFIERRYHLTGVDGSSNMIELCKTRFPKHNWIISNMLTISMSEQFDLIFAWHSFFHLNQSEQRVMLNIVDAHLKPNGLFTFTSGHCHGEVWSDNGGENLYHASLSTNEYKELLEANNFKVLIHTIEDPECGDATIWIAQKNISA